MRGLNGEAPHLGKLSSTIRRITSDGGMRFELDDGSVRAHGLQSPSDKRS